MANDIWLSFADGEYRFHLKNKRIDEVEQKCGAGLGDIYARSMSGMYRDSDDEWVVMPTEARWKNAELAEVVRQGLIGGGECVVDGETHKVEAHRVNQIMANYLEDRPRVELWRTAAAVLHATMEGYEPPKAQAEADPSQSPSRNDTEAFLEQEDIPLP